MFLLVSWALTIGMIAVESPQVSENVQTSKKDPFTSTVDLLKLLPNLKPLEITACGYQRTSGTKKSDLPSPSDTLVQVVGWVELKSERFDQLMAARNGKW